MSIQISQDSSSENKINSESENINDKYLGSVDKKDSDASNQGDIHNTIHNEYLNLVKNGRTMSQSYFKAALGAVYSETFGKSLVFKNIPDDADLQINLKKLHKNFSFAKTHDILKYYSDEAGKDVLKGGDFINLTALFYATLYDFIKNMTPEAETA
jgi:hypothetical protein